MKISSSIVALGTLLLLAVNTLAEPLLLVVEDNRLPGFPLYLAVYAETGDQWLAEPVARKKVILPEAEQFTLPMSLPSARYAIRAFIDLNHNTRLDTSRRERPIEPFAHSAGDNRKRGSHNFQRSVFTLDEAGQQISLTLRYPKKALETLKSRETLKSLETSANQ
ncbi:DUF2141 domain-containing protein [Marinimicrobium sp. ARAG 43.8]|uniref:DUF2141 domain-containing protein n=1 Tax=Marinimicrobium sp. ARAG 43.8 TaxID=3418719 RepID=UPI003CEA34F7